MFESEEQCYRAVQSRDPRFDGWFFGAVDEHRHLLPSELSGPDPEAREHALLRDRGGGPARRVPGVQALPARTRRRVRPSGTSAPISSAGRCGSSPTVSVDREGVAGLARRLNYSERHLHRQLVAEVGAGPIALARAQRAQTARILIETTDVAFSADRVRERLHQHPPVQRHRARGVRDDTERAAPPRGGRSDAPTADGRGDDPVRLPFRAPLDAGPLLDFLRTRAVPGVESVDATTYRRTLELPFGAATVALSPRARAHRLHPAPRRPARPAGRGATVPPALRSRRRSGRGHRAPRGGPAPRTVGRASIRACGSPATSTASSCWCARSSASRCPSPVPAPCSDGSRRHSGTRVRCPTEISTSTSRARRRSRPRRSGRSHAAAPGPRRCSAWRRRSPPVSCSSTRARIARRCAASLLAIPGVGPWTVEYVALRALGDPDAFLPTDLGVRRCPGAPRGSGRRAVGPGAGRALAALALLRAHAPLDEPRGLTNSR